MFPETSRATLVGLFCTRLLAWGPPPAAAGVNVSAVVGEEVLLSCLSPGPLLVLEWRRKDLKSELFVFFFRENRPQEDFQLPEYKGRVRLRDPGMSTGDAGVLLRDVSLKDSGSYECRTLVDTNPRPREPTVHNIVQLWVQDARSEGGASGSNLIWILPTTVVVVCAFLASVLYFRREKLLHCLSKSPRHAPVESSQPEENVLAGQRDVGPEG